jgi:hypothetical protein
VFSFGFSSRALRSVFLFCVFCFVERLLQAGGGENDSLARESANPLATAWMPRCVFFVTAEQNKK